MKLVIAIVQDEDAPALTDALVAAGHRFTKVSTTGSFLRTGNTSLLIGVENDHVPTGHRHSAAHLPSSHPGRSTLFAGAGAGPAVHAGKF